MGSLNVWNTHPCGVHVAPGYLKRWQSFTFTSNMFGMLFSLIAAKIHRSILDPRRPFDCTQDHYVTLKIPEDSTMPKHHEVL